MGIRIWGLCPINQGHFSLSCWILGTNLVWEDNADKGIGVAVPVAWYRVKKLKLPRKIVVFPLYAPTSASLEAWWLMARTDCRFKILASTQSAKAMLCSERLIYPEWYFCPLHRFHPGIPLEHLFKLIIWRGPAKLWPNVIGPGAASRDSQAVWLILGLLFGLGSICPVTRPWRNHWGKWRCQRRALYLAPMQIGRASCRERG